MPLADGDSDGDDDEDEPPGIRGESEPEAIDDRPEDLNDDGSVDSADLGLAIAAWGTDDAAADLNDDGVVDSADIGLLIAAWGDC